MFRLIIFFITLAFIATSIIVSMLNTELINLDLYFISYEAPIPLFLFISFLLGSFLALLFFLSAYIKHKHENMNLKKTMKIKEDEIHSMRRNPLRDDH
tara:strand:- start:76289 stop:76582 length:294 start_codon:yes stop_codon:yes gene_type:complete